MDSAGESVRRMRYTALDKSLNVDHIVGRFRRIGVLPGRFGTHNGVANSWSVDTGTANIHVEITGVLDVNGAPLGDTSIRTTGVGVTVVFGFI